MLPAAGAIAAWLVCAKAWMLALRWCLIFVIGLGLVALSKIVYLGWGSEINAVGFQALSGHAWRATAVLPVLFFVTSPSASGSWRTWGLVLGIALSIGLGTLLVLLGFHTAAEVVVSFILGICAVFLFVRAALRAPAPKSGPWVVPASIAVFVVLFSLKPASVSYRLVDVALFLSGRDEAFRWSQSAKQPVPRAYLQGARGGECRVPGVD